MKEGKRKREVWEWIPPQNKESKFGGGEIPYPKVENRIPLFVIDMDHESNEVFFINNGKESLKEVISSKVGNWPVKEEDRKFSYENVLPGELVKIDDFDPIYDYNELIQQDVCLELENGDRMKFYCTSYGSCVPQTILLWDDQELGKGVNRIQY
ncbi:hypothetical protein [Marinifilum caeruleilacunae]|uniref:Uncharacterized protein n=1 Tax=Marinifilum caeruleilacunae TaxID=2499076 RepID=A0ABX1WX09_9BACT|nr:hypothetical protein [Marinifilum caeruleilacunae]NOU60587.1 hypothetical protein [Marinifilum caeruleilacunae]